MDFIVHTASHVVKIVADRDRERGHLMHKIVVTVLLGVALSASAALAEETGPACKTAEVNPVTGHVFCIDPLGAAVEAPPPEDADPCKPGQHDGEAWTWGPNCKEAPEG
jgi:hypothetical protein